MLLEKGAQNYNICSHKQIYILTFCSSIRMYYLMYNTNLLDFITINAIIENLIFYLYCLNGLK